MATKLVAGRVPEDVALRFQQTWALKGMSSTTAMTAALGLWCDSQSSLEGLRDSVGKNTARRDLLTQCGKLRPERIEAMLKELHDDAWWDRMLLAERATSGKPELQQWTDEERAVVIGMGLLKDKDNGKEADNKVRNIR